MPCLSNWLVTNLLCPGKSWDMRLYIRFRIVQVDLLWGTNYHQPGQWKIPREQKNKKKKESALQDMAVISALQPQRASWQQKNQSLWPIFSGDILLFPNTDIHIKKMTRNWELLHISLWLKDLHYSTVSLGKFWQRCAPINKWTVFL